MLEIVFAAVAFIFIIGAYCYFVAQDSRTIKEILKIIEEEHENESDRD